MFGQDPTSLLHTFPISFPATNASHHLISSLRGCGQTKTYNLHNGGKLQMLTADAPVYRFPSHTPTFILSVPHRMAKADVSISLPFPPVFLTDLLFYFLLSVEPNAALPPSLPPALLHLSAVLHLSPHQVFSQLAERGRRGRHSLNSKATQPGQAADALCSH